MNDNPLSKGIKIAKTNSSNIGKMEDEYNINNI